MIVYGVGLYGFTLLIPPLTRQFGWSRAATGGLVSVFWMTAPLSLAGGYLNKRFGAARLITFGILLEGICLILVGLVSSLWQMYAIRAVMGFGKILVVVAIPPLAAIWFRKRFGSALAISYAGWHLGGLMLAPLAGWLISSVGWRPTCFILGGMIPIIGLPAMLFVLRISSPAQLGLGVDGAAPSGINAAPPGWAVPAEVAEGATLSQVLGSWSFWVIILATVLGASVFSGVLAHEASLSADAGVTGPLAATALGLTAGMAFVGALAMGWLSDHWPFKAIVMLQFGLMAMGVCGFLTLFHLPSLPLLFGSVVAFGYAVGGYEVVVIAHIQARYGSGSFGHVFGIWYFFFAATLFVAPIIVGRSYDITGGYQTGFVIMLAALLLSGTLFFLLPKIRSIG
jgi:MFS family permease